MLLLVLGIAISSAGLALLWARSEQGSRFLAGVRASRRRTWAEALVFASMLLTCTVQLFFLGQAHSHPHAPSLVRSGLLGLAAVLALAGLVGVALEHRARRAAV